MPDIPPVLPSWNEGSTRERIISFVHAASNPDFPSFVYPADRVAVFDNDGTLWCEKPMYAEQAFILDNLKSHIEKNPALKDRPAVAGMLAARLAGLRSVAIAELLNVVSDVFAEMTPEEYEAEVLAWLAIALHPRFGVAYTQLAFAPMLELIGYLRANDFEIVICSAGAIEFARVIAEHVYGIPREFVVGTALGYRVQERAGRLTLVRQASLYGPIDEGSGKAVNIQMQIGRRPVLAVGNSSGDAEMLHMAEGPRAYLCLMIDHDDGEREYSYEGKAASFDVGESGESIARKRGWTVVSMKSDWKTVFGFAS